MAQRRVIAYPMHEYEQARVHDMILDTSEPTDGYRVGLMEESDIETLRAENIIVQYLDGDIDGPTERGNTSMAVTRMSLGMESDISGAPQFGTPAPGEAVNWSMELEGPLTDDVVAAIERYGGEIAQAFDRFRYFVIGTTDMVDELVGIQGVMAVGRHTGEDAAVVPLRATTVVSLDVDADAEPHTWDVILSSPKWLEPARVWLQDRNVQAEQVARRMLHIADDPEPELLGDLANLPGVINVVEHVEPDIQLDHVGPLVGTPTTLLTSTGVAFDGSGQIVAVADTGVHETHADLADRIEGVKAFGRDGDASDPDGHGTHVAGIIAGTGRASDGKYEGIAPGSTLYFQSLYRSPAARLGGLPRDVGNLLDDAYDADARVHNDSWGADVDGAYDGRAAQIDEWAYEHPDMLVVVAAGNTGDASAPRVSPAGYPDEFSIGSPATAKNAITVGASRSDRPSSVTHGDFNPQRFPNPPTADELISGDPESLAGFSSRGPCDDERVKPDVVAPGTCVMSTRSATAADSQYEALETSGLPYGAMSGTSMAAPVVAAMAAIVRQFYGDERGLATPSAALVKATIVNGTRPLAGRDAILGGGQLPNFHQGFGVVDLDSTLPDTTRKLAFMDSWSAGPGPALTRRGDRRRYQVNVTRPDLPLRATLVWTDLPARGVQQILRLFGELPDNSKLIGNESQMHRRFQYDNTNTVETLWIDKAPPGQYLFNVVAERLVRTNAPQHWALVVTGGFEGDLVLRGNY